MKYKPTLRSIVVGLAASIAVVGCITFGQIAEMNTELRQALESQTESCGKKMTSLQRLRDKLQAENIALRAQLSRISSEKRVGVHKGQLKEIIRATLNYVGEKNLVDWTRLIMVTVAAESDCGYYMRQVKGPAQGLLQIEPTSERETLDWLKKYRPDDYEKVKDLRCKARLSVKELSYNHAYSIAVCYWLYRWRKVDPAKMDKDRLIHTYKRYYNTYLGKATIKGVNEKIVAHNIKL